MTLYGGFKSGFSHLVTYLATLFGLGSSLCLVLSHCAVWLGLVAMTDGILLVALADLLALIVRPSVRMGQPCAHGMLHVRLIGTPFEVAHGC